MTLMFSKTRDQALLAMTVLEAGKIANIYDGWVGRTAVQKMVYFLKILGIPLNYKFDIYQYGPFCEQILWDIDYLLADGVIRDKSKNVEKFSNYEGGAAVDELLGTFAEEIEEYRSEIKRVASILVPMPPANLELMSTLDFIYREKIATGQVDNLKESVLSKFNEIKKGKFSEDTVNKTYDAMIEANVVMH